SHRLVTCSPQQERSVCMLQLNNAKILQTRVDLERNANHANANRRIDGCRLNSMRQLLMTLADLVYGVADLICDPDITAVEKYTHRVALHAVGFLGRSNAISQARNRIITAICDPDAVAIEVQLAFGVPNLSHPKQRSITGSQLEQFVVH